MRQHHTQEEKEIRRLRYKILRDNGIPCKAARLLRDWTDSKIEQIITGKAKPLILGVQHVENS